MCVILAVSYRSLSELCFSLGNIKQMILEEVMKYSHKYQGARVMRNPIGNERTIIERSTNK